MAVHRQRRFQAVGMVALLLLLPGLAAAQEIGGTVTDTTGGVLPGVTVEVRSPDIIEQVRTAITDGNGLYLVVALEPGTYSVTYSLPGFVRHARARGHRAEHRFHREHRRAAHRR